MKRIPLTQAQYAIVDDADFDWLSQWKWKAIWSRCTNSFYARRTECSPGGGRKSISMHRLILGLDKGDRPVGDHRNGDTLDCRRQNLRVVTSSQNRINSKLDRRNTSGYKGVTLQDGRWRASLKTKGKRISLGMQDTAEEAYAAYLQGAYIHHGEQFIRKQEVAQ